MCRAFPGSEYYGASAPPAAISRRRACPSLTRLARGGGGHGRFPRSPSAVRPVRHPALPRRPRHGYAADLHRDPGTAETCDTGSGPATIPDRLAARRPISARFEPVRRLQDFTRWFLSYTFRSCLPDPGRLAVPARSGVVRAGRVAPVHCCYRGPLRTAHATRRGTRPKQATRAIQVVCCSTVFPAGRGGCPLRWQVACTRWVRLLRAAVGVWWWTR